MLPKKDINELLRYWLGMIRHEEALGMTVRAAPPVRRDRKVSILDPGRGQPYFKLVPGEEGLGEVAGFALRDAPKLECTVARERGTFFEHWLRGAYYRQVAVSRGWASPDDDGPPVMVGFPVFHDSRRGELRTLLRFGVTDLRWRNVVGAPWELPKPAARRGEGAGPVAGPGAMTLEAEPPAAEVLPYAVDEAVLSRVLGVQEERIGDAMAGLAARVGSLVAGEAARAVIGGLLELIEAEAPDTDDDAGVWLATLTEAVRARILPPTVRVWPIALCYDGGAGLATRQLQNDLSDLIDGRVPLVPATPAWSYLTGRPPRTGRAVHLGALAEHGLTATQRNASERFLGSTLTAVQGPPGTGKTALIHALAAHTLIEQMGGLRLDRDPAVRPAKTLLVCSTNNRAVDNALDPLIGDLPADRLPLALRLGSRRILQEVTLPQLQRAEQWLRRAPASGAVGRLEAAHTRMAELLIELLGPTQALRARRERAKALEQALADRDRLRTEVMELARDAMGQAPVEEPAKAQAELAKAGLALEAWLDQLREALHTKRLKKLRARVARLHRELLALFEGPLPPTSELPQAPDADAARKDWKGFGQALIEEAEEAQSALEDQREALAAPVRLAQTREQLTKAEEHAAALHAAPDDEEGEEALRAEIASGERGLFGAALALREAWAVVERERLLDSIKALIKQLRSSGTLRRASGRDTEAWRDLRRLYPVLGCTLLSLANAFPMRAGVVPRVVIDEAGQCHPAYAVAALFRADKALVIGDVHQLEPVIGVDRREEDRVRRRIRSPLDDDALQPYRALAEGGASAQSVANRACKEVPRLRDHFRCQPEIIAVSNTLCGYDLVVHTPRQSLAGRSPWLAAPVVGVHTTGRQIAFLGSWRNPAEERAVVRIVVDLVRAAHIAPGRIAVLTPYRGQLRALRDGLSAARIPLAEPPADPFAAPTLFDPGPAAGVALGTVHRFQGGERDIVILSAVVSENRSLAFTNGRVNLINVAVSRARLHLVVVGDPEVLSRGHVTATLVRAIPADSWLPAPT